MRKRTLSYEKVRRSLHMRRDLNKMGEMLDFMRMREVD